MGIFIRNDIYGPDAPIQTYRYYSDDSLAEGWIILLFIVSIPFLFMFLMLQKFCQFYASHLILCVLVYLAVSVAAGIFIYRKSRPIIIGAAAIVINFLPLLNLLTFYCIPLMVTEANFDNTLEFVLTTFFCVGAEIFVVALSKIMRNSVKHLLLSIGLFAVAALLLIFMTKQTPECTIDNLKEIYF